MAGLLKLLLAAPEVKLLLSSEHFSVDGTLLRAWASHSSLERLDGLDDDPPPPSGGKGFGSPASGKKRAKANSAACCSPQDPRDREARLFKEPSALGLF